MKITELKNNSTEFCVKVNIPTIDITTEINKELNKIAKTAKFDGFRAGKVPLSILSKKYNFALRSDVVKSKITTAARDVVKDKNLKVFSEPTVENLVNEENKDLEFTLKYYLLPEIPMPDFKKISIEKPVFKAEPKDIDSYIEKLLLASKEYTKATKGKAKNGDQVTIDAVGYVNGKAFNGGTLTAHKLVLGSGVFIPGFEDQLIGTKAGDDVSVKVDFPKNYHEKNLAGKPSEFKVKVLEVHQAVEPKFDDDFAKKLKFDNVEKLKEQVSKNISSTYDDQIETMMKMELFNKLENLLKFDVPQSLLEKETKLLKQQANQIGDVELSKKSAKEQDSYFNKLASRRVKLGLMLSEYVKLHNLQIEKNDMNKAIFTQARNFPGREQEIIDLYLKNHDALESLRGPILEDKAVRTIFEKEIKLVEKSYNEKELEKLFLSENEYYAEQIALNSDHVHGPNCNHESHNHEHDEHKYERDHPHDTHHTHKFDSSNH